MSSASDGECIAVNHVAITLTPENGTLRRNLAQLMFIKVDGPEANKQLREAMSSGLDESAQLEAQFYLLAHTSSDPAVIFLEEPPFGGAFSQISRRLDAVIQRKQSALSSSPK
jgi:hypothetical protein